MPLDVNTFAAKIKAKYPEYKDMDNTLLAQKIVEKYPEYKDQVSFEPLKKKESTTLPSEPSQESGMSVSKTAVKPKPSGSSTSKVEGDLYSGYPSNKGKVYKLDTSTGVPVWHEYSSTVAATKPGEVNKDLYEKPITDASRVNELNKFFKQNASTREGEQVFTGYPGKEKNQYRINNGAWERKVPGQKDWTELNNEASIKSLNAKFGGDVQFKALKAKYSGAVVDTFKAEKEAMDKNLLSVNGNLIGKSEAEVVSSLQSKFPGFEFKKDGLLTDQMIVIAPNKQVLKVSLDNITSGDDSARAVELRNWIKVNSSKELAKVTNELDVLQNVRQGMRYAVPGDKEYVADSPYGQVQIPITNETALEQLGVVNRVKAEEIKQKTSELAKIQAKTFNNIIDESISSNLSQSELNARLAAIPHDKITAKRVNQYSNDVLAISKSKDLKTKELNDFSEEVLSKLKSGEITQEQYDAEYKPQLESKIEAINSQSELLKGELSTVSSVNKSLNESIAKNYLIQQSKGTIVGGVISKALTGATYLPRLMSGGGISAQDQKDLVNLITGGSTTEEYMSSEDRGDITKALFSMAESVGAMATGGLAGGVEGAVAKFAVGSIPFYGQSYYNMKDEFDSIPDVVDKNGNSHSAMSEAEKVLMSGLYATGSAILEKFGLDFALGKTPFGKDLTNSIMKSAFSSIPKNATKEMIEIAIESSAKKLLAQAGVKTLGAMATEGSTEILQAGLEATIKESYDAIKETGYFNNKPDEDGNPTNKTAWEITKGMLYEGYLGALGGGLMSTVSQSKSAITNGLNKALNEEQIQALINTANIDGINDSVLAGLKNNILSGKIDKVEAKEILESFEKVQSHVRSMPENLTDLQKAASLNLLLEKSNKEKQIEGKDKSLVNKQIERVNAINKELKTISNATTETEQAVPAKTQDESLKEFGITKEEYDSFSIEEDLSRRKEYLEDMINDHESNIPKTSFAGKLLDKWDGNDFHFRKGLAKLESDPLGYYTEIRDSLTSEDSIETHKAWNLTVLKLEEKDNQRIKELYTPANKTNTTESNQPIQEKGAILETKNKAGETTGFISEYTQKDGSVIDIDGSTLEEVQGKIDELKSIENQSAFEEVRNLDTNDKTHLERVHSFLDNISKNLDEVLDPRNLNDASRVIPALALKPIVEVLKVAVSAGMSLEQAIKKYVSSQEKYPDQEQYTEKEIHDTLNLVHEVKQKVARENALGAEKLQKQKVAEAKSIGRDKKEKTEVTQKELYTIEERAGRLGKIAGKNEIKVKMKEAISEVRAKHKAKNTLIKEGKTEINDRIKKTLKAGSVTSVQTNVILRKLNRVNMSSQKSIDAFLEYSDKVFNKASHAQDVANAISIKSKISKALKSAANQVHSKQLAKNFTSINPSDVSNIEEYMDIAQEIYQSVKASRRAANMDEINKYIEKARKDKQEELRQNKLDEYNYLVKQGIIDKNTSLKDIQDTIDLIEYSTETTADADISSDREAEVKASLSLAFKGYANTISSLLEEDNDYTPRQIDIAEKLINLDVDALKINDLHRLTEGMENFIVNGIIDGLEAKVNAHEGFINAGKLTSNKKLAKIKTTSALTRAHEDSFASLGVMLDTVFGGVDGTLEFEKAFGINLLSKGANTAETIHNRIIDEYVEKFRKLKPNGDDFNTALNDYERGLIAFLTRSNFGDKVSKQAEFSKNRSLILNSAKDLKSGSKTEQEAAVDYETLVEKFDLKNENLTIEDINSKADPINKKAVDWWIAKWKENSGDLADISESVNNIILKIEENYTPKFLPNLEAHVTEVKQEDLDKMGAFQRALGIDKKTSGVLKESNTPKVLKDQYVSLSFDNNNSNANKAALLDIHTAAISHKIYGALSNKQALIDLIPNTNIRVMVVDRIIAYQRLTKGNAMITNRDLKEINKLGFKAASIGAAKVLGSLDQSVKQTLPIMLSTALQTGNFKLMSAFDRDANNFLDNSGMGIANRGQEASVMLDKIDERMSHYQKFTGSWIARTLKKSNELYLKQILVKSDLIVARASWLAYYEHKLKKMGLNAPDYKTHVQNQEAADYAQHMVDRNQNISEAAKGGSLQTSNNPYVKLIRQTAFPFSSFTMNQKSRMISDMKTWASRTSTKESKRIAKLSLIGMVVEISTFNLVRVLIAEAVVSAAYAYLGEDEDEEEKAKRRKKQLSRAIGSGVTDVGSPMPFFDFAVLKGFNWVADKLQSVDPILVQKAVDKENKLRAEEHKDKMDAIDELKFRKNYIQDQKMSFKPYDKEATLGVDLGAISVIADVAGKVYNLAEVVITGKVTEDYKGTETEKIVLDSDRELLKEMLLVKGIYLGIGLPREASDISDKIVKIVEKRALTDRQYEKYEKIKKKGKELSKVEEYIIRSSSTLDSALGDIRYAERHPELTDDEIIENLKKY